MENNIYKSELKLNFKSLSRVIVSPRSLKALYKNVDFESEDLFDLYENENFNKKIENISIIYSFYSYNERKLNMDSKDINYYLPGSSIKGSLFSGEKNIMCDDVKLKENDIVLDWIYKVVDYKEEVKQGIKSNLKIPKYKEFFENIGIEMLNSEKNFEVIVRVFGNSEENISEKLKDTNKKTIRKLDFFISKIKKVLNSIETDKSKTNKTEISENLAKENITENSEEISKMNTTKNLKEILNNIENIKEKYKKKDNKKIITFLGGFKGKVGTISKIGTSSKIGENIKTGLYFDNKTKLPYGLIEIEVLNKSVPN